MSDGGYLCSSLMHQRIKSSERGLGFVFGHFTDSGYMSYSYSASD